MMQQATLRILGIAPYEGMRSAMAKEAELFPQLQADFYTGDLADGVAIVKQLENEYYDAIVSRGGTAEMIRRITPLPVISIQISVYDIMRAMKMAETYASKYAIVGFASVTKPAHTLCDLLQNNVDIVTISDRNEVEPALRQLRNNGCRTIVCDMVTHTYAREIGMDAFLITSGAESIHNAFELVITICSGIGKLRRQNIFLQALAEETESDVTVLSDSGEVEFSSQSNQPEELLTALRRELPRVVSHRSHQFFVEHKSDLFQVTARKYTAFPEPVTMFFYSVYQIPTRSKNSGVIARSQEECRHLFQRSLFSISGALGELEQKLRQTAATPKPVMILGEYGTGKEQIARAIYLYSGRNELPLITIDCALVNEKGWEFLFEHDASPIHSRSATIYMKRLESMPEKRLAELLSILIETNISRRLRLIFSCDKAETAPIPRSAKSIIERVSCLMLTMPALRNRSDEIPLLATLYLSALNVELGKQLIGPEPQAARLLQQYDWPGNYVQFQNLLYELATVTEGSYLRSLDVTQLLSRERQLRYAPKVSSQLIGSSRTLEEITLDAVAQALEDNDGNQSKAAAQLGISRSTLWRYLKQLDEKRLV